MIKIKLCGCQPGEVVLMWQRRVRFGWEKGEDRPRGKAGYKVLNKAHGGMAGAQ